MGCPKLIPLKSSFTPENNASFLLLSRNHGYDFLKRIKIFYKSSVNTMPLTIFFKTKNQTSGDDLG